MRLFHRNFAFPEPAGLASLPASRQLDINPVFKRKDLCLSSRALIATCQAVEDFGPATQRETGSHPKRKCARAANAKLSHLMCVDSVLAAVGTG